MSWSRSIHAHPPAVARLAAMALLVLGSIAQADTVYKVFDDKGDVTYQAEPPSDPNLRFEALEVESAQRFLEASGKADEEAPPAEGAEGETPPPAEKGGVILIKPELRQEPSGLPEPPAGPAAPAAPSAPPAPTPPAAPPAPRGGF
jgi:hypothetical protein